MMDVRIAVSPERKIVGKRLEMSFADNRTSELWRSFMPFRHSVPNTLSTDLISMQDYPEDFSFCHFDPDKTFEKWAAVEVSAFGSTADFENTVIPEGLYAVFQYIGSAENAGEAFGYIFKTWLPDSGYALDDRPHFEILGEKYRNNSADSQEEIWIPIRPI